MKAIFVIFIFLISSYAQALTVEQKEKLRNYCGSLSEEKREINKYCSKIKIKKKKVKKRIQRQYKTVSYKKVKDYKKRAWNLYLTGAVLGDVKGYGAEVSHRWQKMEVGLFYRTIDRQNEDLDLKIEGKNYGLSLRYHFLPLKITSRHSMWDPAMFLKLGRTSLDNPLTESKDNYFSYTLGMDASYPLFNIGSSQIKGYTQIGLHYVNNSEDGNLHFGSDLGLGLLWEF